MCFCDIFHGVVHDLYKFELPNTIWSWTLYLTVSVCVYTSSWKVTKNDLEQRHPQLDDIFTLAQNIKNKTSNLDVRTSITEKCMYKAG